MSINYEYTARSKKTNKTQRVVSNRRAKCIPSEKESFFG